MSQTSKFGATNWRSGRGPSGQRSVVKMRHGHVEHAAGCDDQHVGLLGAIRLQPHRERDLLQRRRTDREVAQRRLHARRLAGGHEVRGRHAPGASHTGAAVQEHRAAAVGDDVQELVDLSRGRRLAVADRQRDGPQPERSERRVVDRPIGFRPQVHDRRDPGRRQRPVSLQGGRRRAVPHSGVDGGEVGDIANGCGDRRRRWAGEVLEQERRDEDRQVADDHEQHERDDGAPGPDERSLVSPPRAPVAGAGVITKAGAVMSRDYIRRQGQGQRVRARRRGARQLAATRWMA